MTARKKGLTIWQHITDDGEPKLGRRPILNKKMITACVARVFDARKRRAVHPEGTFDAKHRWYPSNEEDADGDGSSVRPPSAAWPYSYLLRCRTRQHCRVLVEGALAGKEVPDDIAKEVEGMTCDLKTAISAWDARDSEAVEKFRRVLVRRPSKPEGPKVVRATIWEHLGTEKELQR